jgi:uncharacterized protein YdhG (YjbR/CyaY superfamily)
MSKPTTIEEYIATAAPEVQSLLKQLLETLRAAAPHAVESIKWNEPAFKQNRILFMFSAHKKHVAFAPTPSVIREFKDRLGAVETTNSTVKFSIGEPLPVDLVTDMAVARLRDVIDNDARWM